MENQFKGTPGPWFANDYGGFITIQNTEKYSDNDLLDCDKCICANANAQLIAAAPDLLEALQQVAKDCIDNQLEGYIDLPKIISVINKALGL